LSTHSMRHGGTTTLANDPSIPDHIITKYGRWSSAMWKQVYQHLRPATTTAIATSFARRPTGTVG
jgi:hypothetical protein